MKESFRDYADDDLFQFDKLKLVEKPNDPKNASSIPQTLFDCKGYLEKLPLKKPNVDQKNPTTIVNMINILTNPEASAMFDKEVLQLEQEEEEDNNNGGNDRVLEGFPSKVYNYKTPLMTKLLKNMPTSHTKAPSIFGHIVDPGCISLYKRDGKTFAVGEGRWFLTSPKASWFCRNIPLDQDLIHPTVEGNTHSKLLIIRVLPGEVGLVREQGQEVLLDVGTHVFNSGTVSNFGKKTYYANEYFHHGRYHYVRVPRGSLAKVWVEVKGSVSPRLLAQGEHFCDSHLFRFGALAKLSDEYIAHGSIHRISVPKDSVAKVVHNNKPRLLGEGDHLIESPQFQFQGFENIISKNCIVHGTITILRVTLGQIALAWINNDPVFIDVPGLYEYDSPDFDFVEFKDAEERLIQLGAKKVIIVHTGQVGVTYDKGLLKILKDGRHIINSSTHIFHRFLSTQQKSIRLATLPASEKLERKSYKSKAKKSAEVGDVNFSAKFGTVDHDSDLTICETKDLVKVGLRADVFYSIADPEKCINKIDTDELEDLVRETAVATLTNIIRSTALNEIAQSKQVSAGSADSAVAIMQPPTTVGSESSTMFFEKAHDEFLLKLHDDFMQRYGVDIANIRIESFKIMDTELSDQISKHALTTAQIENEMANLEGKSLISTTEERTAAEVKNISAEAEAASLKTIADAANQRKIDAASAEAESLKIAARAKAEAEAESIRLKATAEAEAIKLKASAEAQRAEMLSKTGLGKQEALLNIYSDMVVNSNQGVEKVVYLDPTVSRESPFALSSLHNLNQDLHSLTQLGIAASETNGVKKDGQ